MIRESLAPNSRQAQMIVSAAFGLSFQYRPTVRGNSFSTTVSGAAPAWTRIDRTGNLLTGCRSTDGVNWVQVGNVTLAMGSTIYLGLAVTSHNSPVLCTAAFENILATK